MRAKLEKAIEVLAAKVGSNCNADDALKFTQAALNLAHTISTLRDVSP